VDVKLNRASRSAIDGLVTSPTPGNGQAIAVVQLYIHQRAGSASRPFGIEGFERLMLEPVPNRRFTSRWKGRAAILESPTEEVDGGA